MKVRKRCEANSRFAKKKCKRALCVMVELDDEDMTLYENKENKYLDHLMKTRAREVLEGAINRMRKRGQSKAWERWQEW